MTMYISKLLLYYRPFVPNKEEDVPVNMELVAEGYDQQYELSVEATEDEDEDNSEDESEPREHSTDLSESLEVNIFTFCLLVN